MRDLLLTTTYVCTQTLRGHGHGCRLVGAIRRMAADIGCTTILFYPADDDALKFFECERLGAGVRQLQGLGPSKFVLDVDTDNEFRTRCE